MFWNPNDYSCWKHAPLVPVVSVVAGAGSAAGGAISAAAPLIAAGGTAVSMISAYQQGKAQEEAYEAQEEALKAEAKAKKRAAGEEARKLRRRGIALKGTQIAQMAKEGVVPGAGTGSLILEQTRRDIEEDAAKIQEHGATAAQNLYGQAAYAGSMAKAVRKASLWRMGTSALTGAYNLGQVWPKKKKLNLYEEPWSLPRYGSFGA